MGWFGDRDMGRLDRRLDEARLVVAVSGSGTLSEDLAVQGLMAAAENTADAVVRLCRKGRAGDARACLDHARGSIKADPAGLWDDPLDLVEEVLP